MHTIKVYTKRVYGIDLVYPCPYDNTAITFASLLRVKTFNHQQLAGIEALGYTIINVTTKF